MPYKNKQDLYDYINRLRIENRNKAKKYLKSHPCVDCGEDNWIVLDFDHVRGKKKNNVKTMCGARCYSWKTILKEIKKCEVRCANCHRIITHKRLKNKPL